MQVMPEEIVGQSTQGNATSPCPHAKRFHNIWRNRYFIMSVTEPADHSDGAESARVPGGVMRIPELRGLFIGRKLLR
jgi:hypothetical protein